MSRFTILSALLLTVAANGATLPAHRPLRILVVGDNVNPHMLPADQLTEIHDIFLAITTAGNGLNLDPSADGVVEVATDQIELATAALSVPFCDPSAYDVVVYFAHRIPSAPPNQQGRQDAFAAAVDAFLQAGGGFVCFHHGAYFSTGKTGILDLIGCTASGAVPYDTMYGQDVVNVAPAHFVTTNGVTYASTTSYADPARGVPMGTYPVINNVPDEQYPNFVVNANATAEVQLLFGGKYSAADVTPHLLGWTHARPAWKGVVVGFQPAEYQPNALNVNGWQFQILANAILYAATHDATHTTPPVVTPPAPIAAPQTSCL